MAEHNPFISYYGLWININIYSMMAMVWRLCDAVDSKHRAHHAKNFGCSNL